MRLPRFRGSPALCVDQAATCAVPVDGLDVAPRHGTKKVHPSSHGGRRSRSKGWSIRRCLAVHAMCRENLSGHLSHKSQRCPRSRVNPSSGSFQPPPGTLGIRAARDRPRASNVNGISSRNEQLPAGRRTYCVATVQVRGVASEQPPSVLLGCVLTRLGQDERVQPLRSPGRPHSLNAQPLRTEDPHPPVR